MSCNGAVVTVTTVWAIQQRNWGSTLRRRERSFPITTRRDELWVLEEQFFAGVKRPRPENPHSPSFSAEVKNEWNNTSAHIYVFMKNQASRYFAFTLHLLRIKVIFTKNC